MTPVTLGGVSLQSVWLTLRSLNQKKVNVWTRHLRMSTKTEAEAAVSREPSLITTHTQKQTHTRHSVMRLGGLPCQDVRCSVSCHWVTRCLSTTLYIAGGNTLTHTNNHKCQTVYVKQNLMMNLFMLDYMNASIQLTEHCSTTQVWFWNNNFEDIFMNSSITILKQ